MLRVVPKKDTGPATHPVRAIASFLGDCNTFRMAIEVKATTFGRETPFYVSDRELALSQGAKDQVHLYRLFDFRMAPRLFDLPGALGQHCVLDPVRYRASFS